MRFFETLLLVLLAINVAQLVIASLIIATLMLFLWCLYKRPKESLVLGLAVLTVALISKPVGLALVAAIFVGFIGLGILEWVRARRGAEATRPPLRLPKL